MNLNEDQVKIIVKCLSQRLLDLRRVAQNDNTPAEVLSALAHDADADVRHNAAQR